MTKDRKSIQGLQKNRSTRWELRNGEVLVVEDAQTASLVIVAKRLKNLEDKITVLKEVLLKFERQVAAG